MKFLVAMVAVPDTTSKIEFTNDQKALKKEGITFIFNPYDEYALTRALELKQAGDTVTVITLGTSDTDPLIRKALAMGADDAIRIDVAEPDAYRVAVEIAQHASAYDLILLGKESISQNEGLVGGMLSALLSRPFVSEVSALTLQSNLITCTVDEASGSQLLLEVALPAIVSASEGLVGQVIMASMRGIMTAKTKPLQVLAPVMDSAYVSLLSYELPPVRSGCEFFEDQSTLEGKINHLVVALRDVEKLI